MRKIIRRDLLARHSVSSHKHKRKPIANQRTGENYKSDYTACPKNSLLSLMTTTTTILNYTHSLTQQSIKTMKKNFQDSQKSQDQMKGQLGGQWNKIFMKIFRSMLYVFLPFSTVFLTELCSFQHGLKVLFTLLKLANKVVLDH